MALKVSFLPHQPPVFDCPAPNVVYVKGRRAGGTFGAVNRLIEIAHQRPGSRHLWVDTVHRNIDRYLRRYFLPRLKGTGHCWNAGRKELRFQSGALCDFGSAQRPQNIEGFAYDFIWLNEAGIILRDEKLYHHTLLPMLAEADSPKFFAIGTPKGPGLFKRMFEWGQDPENEAWRSFRHASARNPLLNRETLEWQRTQMPERAYRQEIEAEFVEGQGTVFREVERIARARPESQAEPGVPYVLGVDLARYRDYTVIWVGRADVGAGVSCERFNNIPWRSQAERIAGISRRFGDAPLFVDSTGVGDPVAEDLQTGGLPVHPVVLSAPKKRILIDSLALAIEQERLTIIPHEQTVRELLAYEHTLLPSGHSRTAAPPGGHDDCVIALALCHWGMSGGESEFILGSNLVTCDPDW
jgi:hypothetical protein